MGTLRTYGYDTYWDQTVSFSTIEPKVQVHYFDHALLFVHQSVVRPLSVINFSQFWFPETA